MEYKEIKTEKGILKYRMPNIVEAYKFLGKIGVFKKDQDMGEIKGKAIEELAIFLDIKGIPNVATFDDLLVDIEKMAEPLSDIADEVLRKALLVFKKKTI